MLILQRKRMLITSVIITFLLLLSVMSRLSVFGNSTPERYEVTIDRDVPLKMRDGVVLKADIYRPKSEGKFPVLLQRTPYDKLGGWFGEMAAAFGLQAAARGYVVINQDVRGRFTSEGEWYPFKYEAQDGYDTIEWAASLPYSNGKVGMFGNCYLGATQMLPAVMSPPHLAGIMPAITASNYHEGWVYQGGAFSLHLNQSWTTSYLALNTHCHRVQEASQLEQSIWNLPVTNYPVLNVGTTEGLVPYYYDWAQHPNYDDYWKQWSVEEHYPGVLVPAYHVSGWYDVFQVGTLRNYIGLKARAGNEAARRGQRLIIGPWTHGKFDSQAGELSFGPDAKIDITTGEVLRWYDYLFKGVQNGFEREKPVKIFVMGKNVWREEDDWPLPRARNTRYYLHSGANANSLLGKGTLSAVAPQSEPGDHYIYDPADPVPTRGGDLCCDWANLIKGVADQRVVEVRDDVLVYSTPPFKEDFEVTGPLSVELYVSSSAVDTDFTAKLVDVWPNGYAQNLNDGILRMRYRNSLEKPELMNPGEVYKIAIDAWATSNDFQPGHRLRLEISSSNFPRFDRNLNTGENPASGTRRVKAENTIYHDADHPSAVLLPVVPRQ